MEILRLQQNGGNDTIRRNGLFHFSRKSLWVKLAFLDGGYAGDETERGAFEASRIRICVVKCTDRTVKGFIVLPKR
jgi:hypothetical protein